MFGGPAGLPLPGRARRRCYNPGDRVSQLGERNMHLTILLFLTLLFGAIAFPLFLTLLFGAIAFTLLLQPAEPKSHKKYALSLAAVAAFVFAIANWLLFFRFVSPDESADIFLPILFLATLFIGHGWLRLYRETHPREECNRAQRIVESLPPEYQDHVLRFVEAAHLGREVDIKVETERIANIVRRITDGNCKAVLAKVAREMERQPEILDSFYNVGYYK
jgi:hypothetical protein